MNSQTAKFIAVVAENLPSEMSPEAMQRWIQNPRSLQGFLKGLCSPEASSVFERFMTIKLGTSLQSVDDFRRALKKGGFRLGSWGNDILDMPAFTVATEETKVDLVVVSVSELGFKDGATRREIYSRAVKLGLKLCPPEVAPQLRLQYRDQPRGEWFLIGMEPITNSSGDLSVFGVGHDDDGFWLIGRGGRPDGFWGGGGRWVFLRRK